MKALLLLIAALLLSSSAYATIEIKVTQYDPDSQNARIRLHNAGSIDYHDVTLSVDEYRREYPGSLLKPGTAIAIPVSIAAGTRDVVVTTSEGFVVKKTITFAKNVAQVQQERERQNEIDERVRGQQQDIQRIQQARPSPRQQDTSFNRVWLLLPIALITLFLIFYFLKQRPKPKLRPSAPRPPPPPHQPPARPRQRMQPVSRVILNRPQRKTTARPPPSQKAALFPAPEPPHDVFQHLPQSGNVFDKLPGKTNQDTFARLRALKHR